MKRPLLLLLLLSAAARAEIAVPPLFSDHAVLQKAARVPVWGKAAPGERIVVSLGGTEAKAVAAASGAWEADLDLSEKGPGPYDLTISGSASAKPFVAADVVVGEVWLAAGQSNMEFRLNKAADGAREIAASANPQLRQFLVAKKSAARPQDVVGGSWTVAGPADSGGFTAVGYYFGKKLQNELGGPVGIVHASWGGTPIEAWTSAEALASLPDMKEGAEKDRSRLNEFPLKVRAYADALAAWETQYGRSLPVAADPAPPAVESGWQSVTLPLAASSPPLPSGVVWLRRKVVVSPEAASARAPLEYGAVPGFDAAYWNGAQLGATTPQSGGVAAPRRYYLLPAVELKPGEGVLTIRLACAAAPASLPGPLRWGAIPLDGMWEARVEKELPPPTAEARAAYPAPLPPAPFPWNTASFLYNAMIAPLVPYAIHGVIWYQGETNTGRAFQYRTALPLMIRDWRARWGEGDFPFYLCQLANFQPRQPLPGESKWAELRDAQASALSLPRTGMAVLIDCGDEGDVHPRDKRTPGDRLAAVALADSYGKEIPCAGPQYASFAVEGDAVRVRFAHAGGGLVARPVPADYAPKSAEPEVRKPLIRNVPGSQLEGFALCGEDHAWKWAEAAIDGETVVVRAKGVQRPVAVRYAWADNPLCNLYNDAGFPAAPFRSDAFPGVTDQSKF